MLWVPLVANVPLQPPEAVQEVALVELQVNVDAAPLSTAVGAAVSDPVGSGETAAVGDLDPPHAARSSAATTATIGVNPRMRDIPSESYYIIHFVEVAGPGR